MNQKGPGFKELLAVLVLFTLAGSIILGWKYKDLGTLSDVPFVDPAGVLQVKSWQEYNAQEFGHGGFPLWNPHTGLGQPHLANIQTAAFYPFFILYYILNGPLAYDIILCLRLLFSAFIAYWFFRKWWLEPLTAASASLVYAFGGYCLWFLQLIDVNSQIFLPLIMHLWGRLVMERKPATLVLGGLASAVIISGGHPEASFNTIVVGGLFALFVMFTKGRSVVRPAHGIICLAASMAAGVLFSQVLLIPFVNYLSRSFSLHGPGFGFFHMDIRGILNLLYPGISRVFSDLPSRIPIEMLDGGMLGMLTAGYSETSVPGVPPGAGILVLFLAFAGILGLRQLPSAAAFFASLLFVLLGLTFGLPLFRLLALLPPLHVASNFKFYFSEIHFCVAALAGFGIKWLISRKSPAFLFFWTGTFAAIALALIYARLTPNVCHYPCGVVGANILGYDSAWLFMAVVLITLAKRRMVSAAIYSPALVIVIVGSLFYRSIEIGPYINLGTKDIGQAQYLKYLENQSERQMPFRITGLEGFFPANTAMRFGMDDIRSSDALFYKPYTEFLNALNRQTEKQSIDYFYPSYYTRPSPEHLDEGLAALAGIKYVVGRRPLDTELIIEDALVKAKYIIAQSRPQKTLSARYKVETPVLFMHAPARLDHYIETRADERTLEFLAWLDRNVLSRSDADGAEYQVKLYGPEGARLAYSRYFARVERPPQANINSVDLEKISGDEGVLLSLVTLPGPLDNLNSDWTGWSMLALRKAGVNEVKSVKTEDQEGFTVFISEIPGAFPRVFSVSRALVADDKETRLKLLENLSAESLRDAVILESTSGVNGLPGDRGDVKWLGRSSDSVEFLVRRASPGYLVFSDAAYPGWKAWLNGKESKILRADHALKCVAVPRGLHRVRFAFMPMDFRLGLWSSLASGVCGLIVLLMAAFKKRERC